MSTCGIFEHLRGCDKFGRDFGGVCVETRGDGRGGFEMGMATGMMIAHLILARINSLTRPDRNRFGLVNSMIAAAQCVCAFASAFAFSMRSR